MDPGELRFLHAVVKEFLESCNFTETLDAYNNELTINSIEPQTVSLPSQLDERSGEIKDNFLQLFELGNHDDFWIQWNKRIPKQYQEESETQRLEFKLQLYFAVFCLREETRLSPVEAGMEDFKRYLENNGALLSQTTEFVAFYALPYVPNPKSHPTFKILFQEEWRSEVKTKLKIFLEYALQATPLPFLYKLHMNSQDDSKGGNEEGSDEKAIKELKEEMQQIDKRANSYFEKFTKLQEDYHNLIGIAAELVDSLEQCVLGKMITPDYLQDICQRLFGKAMRKDESQLDFTIPGTASSMLRASVSLNPESPSQGISKELDIAIIQKDLLGPMTAKNKALLLQALIWQLTKKTLSMRDEAILTFVTKDLLGCVSGSIKELLLTISSNEDIVLEYLCRLVNVISSFTMGRTYLSQSHSLVSELVRLMMKLKVGSMISENLLGGLQKLSLKRHVQTILIEMDVISWLFSILEDPDNLSDYAVEYAVALLMNLCLRTSGKKKCCSDSKGVLKLLSDLLGYDNTEIRPYVNGTVYSLLSLPSMRTVALSMGYEDVLNCYLLDKSQDERQIRFIIKQLNADEPKTNDDVQTDDENEDDDDEEGDAVEIEMQKPESIYAAANEKHGDELLRSRYLNSSTSTQKGKKKPALLNASLQDDIPLTRPITPAIRSSLMNSSSEPAASDRIPSSHNQRPRTSSSKGSRRSTSEEANMKNKEEKKTVKNPGSKYHQGFTSRPKIPRTPDVSSSSRSSSRSDVPPLTRSLSPQRPDSEKGSRSESHGMGIER